MIILLKALFLCTAMFSAGQAQNMLEKTATVGQNIAIPCGVQVKENLIRLVWKREDVTRTENLAHNFDGEMQCNAAQRESCALRQDGSLELHNVQEKDSGDYFCVVDNENYYSKHTLVVHPEVSFEGCPNSAVSVTQVGPDMKILAYTSPVCMNADVVGIVSCDPPSGVKVGMNVTEINCTCTHSDIVADTCVIPIPDVSPCYVVNDSGLSLEPVPKVANCHDPLNLLWILAAFTFGFMVSHCLPIIWIAMSHLYKSGKGKKRCWGTKKESEDQQNENEELIVRTDYTLNDGSTSHVRTQSTESGKINASPVEQEDTDGQLNEVRHEEHAQVQPDIPLPTPQEETDGQGTERSETRQEHVQGQPDMALPTQVTEQQETIPNDAVELEMDLLMPDFRRQRLSSAIKVTTNPQYPGQNVQSGSQSDGKPVTMDELILNFQSGPRITLLPLNEIRPYGLEIRSPSDGALKVIRKSEEKYDVPLVCQKDGQRWDIHPGDQSDFYVSCGNCNEGCLLVGISGGEQNLKKTTE